MLILWKVYKKLKDKYINSQENNFQKSQILYGLKQNLAHIREEKEVYLVEGYGCNKTILLGYKKGFISGTTSEIQLQKCGTSDVPYVCFDGDCWN